MSTILFVIAVLVLVYQVGKDVARTETIAKMGDEIIKAVRGKTTGK
jgi:hypothetical protein